MRVCQQPRELFDPVFGSPHDLCVLGGSQLPQSMLLNHGEARKQLPAAAGASPHDAAGAAPRQAEGEVLEHRGQPRAVARPHAAVGEGAARRPAGGRARAALLETRRLLRV